MIKRILVALDLDSDTVTAIRYALEIAERFGSMITGLAVVDMGSIDASSKGGGIGSMYYAEKLRESLTAEAREKAQMLIELFKKTVERTNVRHSELVEEGVPFQRIIEDVKYHDLLVVGNDPHFFYSHPKHDTNTLARIVNKTIGPTLVVQNEYRDVKRVLIATDGTNEASRAMQRFVHFEPFGKELEIRILNVASDESAESNLLLQMSKVYMESHGFKITILSSIDETPEECILGQCESFEADLIVMGGHTKKTILSEKLGEATSYLIEKSEVPIFMDH